MGTKITTIVSDSSLRTCVVQKHYRCLHLIFPKLGQQLASYSCPTIKIAPVDEESHGRAFNFTPLAIAAPSMRHGNLSKVDCSRAYFDDESHWGY